MDVSKDLNRLGKILHISPRSHGDDAEFINNAIQSINGPVTIILDGSYHLNSSIVGSKDRVHIKGSGLYTTTCFFDPKISGIAAISFFKSDKSVNVQSSIEDLSLVGIGSKQKIGIDILDNDLPLISNVAIQNWWGNNGNPSMPSTGIIFRGRDHGIVEKITINADLPIHIKANPNNYETLDHFIFRDLFLIANDPNQYCILVNNNTVLQNVTFEGRQAWALGKGGFYWDNSLGYSLASTALRFDNVRYEQPPGISALDRWLFYINSNLNTLIMNNNRGGDINGTNIVHGFFLKMVNKASLIGNQYIGTGIALSLDTCVDISTQVNKWWSNSSIVLAPNMREILSMTMPKTIAAEPGSGTAYYTIQ